MGVDLGLLRDVMSLQCSKKRSKLSVVPVQFHAIKDKNIKTNSLYLIMPHHFAPKFLNLARLVALHLEDFLNVCRQKLDACRHHQIYAKDSEQ